jgi:YgiT-type zinc finger domain-containing protein
MGNGFQREKALMKCVICKRGEVKPASVQAELKIGDDRVLVRVQAEACTECGEAYYSPETMRYLEEVRDAVSRRTVTPMSIGHVYQLTP